jgi:NADH-quinone oxidoreductase subunit L
VVIDALHDEHDIFKMGGLKSRLPVAYWTFLIGSASLSAIPLVTAGFYSKDAIIYASWSSTLGSTWFMLAGVAGAFITAAYTFRAFFLIFFGEQKSAVVKQPGSLMKFSLIVLAFFSITAGFIGAPPLLGGKEWFQGFVENVLPPLSLSPVRSGAMIELTLLLITGLGAIAMIYLAYLYTKRTEWSQAVAQSNLGRRTHAFFFTGWGFDWLYDRLFIRPYKAIAYGDQSDVIDRFYTGLAQLAEYANKGLSTTETGRLRDYAAGLILGAIVVAIIVMLR